MGGRGRGRYSPALLLGCAAMLLPLLFAVLVLVAPAPAPRQPAPAPAPGPVLPAGAPVAVQRLISARERDTYLGNDRECVSCHTHVADQLTSSHARTAYPVDHAAEANRFRLPGGVVDPLTGRPYRPAVSNGRCVIQTTDGTRTLEAVAEYAIGSGKVGTTFLSYLNGIPTELRLTHYAKGNTWHFTPGQQTAVVPDSPLGKQLDRRGEAACFVCHSSAVVRREGGLDLSRSLLGVGCEGCHGPGKAHAEAMRRGEQELHLVRLAADPGRTSTEVCGRCHRIPTAADMPQQQMTAQMPRLQSLALSWSACAQKGGLNCLSCHDSHRDADRHPETFYNRKCSGCHQPGTAGQVPCPREPRGRCVQCHMPAQEIGMPNRPRFRTHWIKVWEEQEAAEPAPLESQLTR